MLLTVVNENTDVYIKVVANMKMKGSVLGTPIFLTVVRSGRVSSAMDLGETVLKNTAT